VIKKRQFFAENILKIITSVPVSLLWHIQNVGWIIKQRLHCCHFSPGDAQSTFANSSYFNFFLLFQNQPLDWRFVTDMSYRYKHWYTWQINTVIRRAHPKSQHCSRNRVTQMAAV
jgi:hypothetical protein